MPAERHTPPDSSTRGPGLRVAMIIQRFRPDFSGHGIQLEQLCAALARRGAHPVIVSAVRGRAAGWESCDGYEVRRIRADFLPGSRTSSRLRTSTFGVGVWLALMRMGPIDVVHVHGLHDGLYGAAAYCRMRGVPLILEMTLMGVDDPGTALATTHRFASLRRRAYRGADAYVAMSRAFLPRYAAAGLPPDRLSVIPQGVDTTRFRPRSLDERRLIRDELGCPPDASLVVFLGSLIERKGVDVLLAAWRDVHAARPDARLVLAGRDDFPEGSSERGFFDARLALVPADARQTIHRIGLRPDAERVLAAADVFAFPSRQEGFGSVIIEAMACGVPAVVSRLDGITNFIFRQPLEDVPTAGDGHDGVVVPQDDPPALARAVVSILGDPDRRAAIGAAGRARVHEAFDLEQAVTPAYERLYAAVTDRRR